MNERKRFTTALALFGLAALSGPTGEGVAVVGGDFRSTIGEGEG